MDMRFRVITQESVGQFLHIRMEIVRSQMENIKGKHYPGCLKNHRELFGNIEGDQFPLLVKIIDEK